MFVLSIAPELRVYASGCGTICSCAWLPKDRMTARAAGTALPAIRAGRLRAALWQRGPNQLGRGMENLGLGLGANTK